MCDDDSTYTERAKSWLKESELTPEQIQDAYTRMLGMLTKKPEVANGDTDECLELLVSAFGQAGGSVDDLLSAHEAKKLPGAAKVAQAEGEEPSLDCGALYEVSDYPAVVLAPSEKRAAFLKLKDQLQKRASAA